MKIQANGERNLTLDFDAPKKFKLLQNGVEVPYLRTGKNSVRLSKAINGLLDLEEIPEAPKSIVKPMQLQPQQMALVNPADVISINQAAQQLEIEQNILGENQKRFESVQNYVDIQQQRIDETVNAVKELETDNANRITATEQSIFTLAGGIARIEEDTANGFEMAGSELQAHKTANNPHNITKETIGLGRVDNTADIDKPVSNAVRMALEEKADKDEIEQIREEIAEYQDKNEKINNALANYTGGIGGNELPIGGLTGQVLAKKSDENGDYEWISSSAVPGNGVLTLQKNGTDVGTFSANTTRDTTVNFVIPTQASDINALPDSTKYGSSISLTIDNSTFIVTAQLKDQDGNNLGTAQTIDLPLESVVVNGSYDSVNKKIILTLQNGNTIDIPVSDLISGLLKTGDNISLLTNDAGYITASSLPTVNNGQLDIQVNGSSIATFTANQATNTTADITIPDSLPDQTGNAGKYLTTDGSDASWEYTVGTLTNYASNVQYYPGDYVQYYTQGGYHKYICIQPALNKTPPNTNYWLENTRDLPFNVSGGEQPILAYSRTGWSGDTIKSIALYVPGSNTGYGNQPTVNLYSGLIKAPGGIDGYSPDSAFGATAFSNDYDDLDNLPNYGAGLSYSSSSLQLLDQNGNNLGSAVTIKSTPDLDGVTIDTNSSDELEAIGTVNKNTAVGATAVKYDWIGTLAEYNSQNVETLHPEWVCYITDDVSGGTSVYTKAEVDSAISTALTTMLDSAFPVGSRYITEASTCPLATLIPNSTWVLTSQGRVIQGADSNHLAGTTAEAGLPNITGQLGYLKQATVSNYNNPINLRTGAFSSSFETTASPAQKCVTPSSTDADKSGVAVFNASNSSSIYGNSTTVQPPAEFVNIFKRTV